MDGSDEKEFTIMCGASAETTRKIQEALAFFQPVLPKEFGAPKKKVLLYSTLVGFAAHRGAITPLASGAGPQEREHRRCPRDRRTLRRTPDSTPE
jgi:hypothetical protein